MFQSVNKDIDQCHLGAVEVEGLDQEMGEKFRSVEEKRADFFEVKVQLNCLGLTAGVDSWVKIGEFAENLINFGNGWVRDCNIEGFFSKMIFVMFFEEVSGLCSAQ